MKDYEWLVAREADIVSVPTPWSYYFVRGGATVVCTVCVFQLITPGALALVVTNSFIAAKAIFVPGVGVVIPLIMPDSMIIPIVDIAPLIIDPLAEASLHLTKRAEVILLIDYMKG